jgi:hypothetical protein
MLHMHGKNNDTAMTTHPPERAIVSRNGRVHCLRVVSTPANGQSAQYPISASGEQHPHNTDGANSTAAADRKSARVVSLALAWHPLQNGGGESPISTTLRPPLRPAAMYASVTAVYYVCMYYIDNIILLSHAKLAIILSSFCRLQDAG